MLYLPGVTAPPAGLRGDVQPLAAGLKGHEGELADRTAAETVQRRCHGDAHHGCPGNEEDEEGEREERHAGYEDKHKKHLNLKHVLFHYRVKNTNMTIK